MVDVVVTVVSALLAFGVLYVLVGLWFRSWLRRLMGSRK